MTEFLLLDGQSRHRCTSAQGPIRFLTLDPTTRQNIFVCSEHPPDNPATVRYVTSHLPLPRIGSRTAATEPKAYILLRQSPELTGVFEEVGRCTSNSLTYMSPAQDARPTQEAQTWLQQGTTLCQAAATQPQISIFVTSGSAPAPPAPTTSTGTQTCSPPQPAAAGRCPACAAAAATNNMQPPGCPAMQQAVNQQTVQQSPQPMGQAQVVRSSTRI